MKQLLSRAVVGVVALSGLSIGFAAPADAAVYTSNGVRCTKVGTSAGNTLTGTSGRDVICGRGGNDVIRGFGGNDVLDGGSGNDRIDGGTGADTLLGGSGADTESGSTGADKVYGSTGADKLYGGDQNDYLSGGDGNDYLAGDAGNDSATGGDDQDTLKGGTGADNLRGSYGNDDLDGNSGADAINGGTGTNWCTVDPADTSRTQCVYDQEPAAAVDYTLSRSTVDVTSSLQAVEISVHVTDDTGVRRVQIGGTGIFVGTPSLVSGTIRNGWWKATTYIQRYASPMSVSLLINMTDRVGRQSFQQFDDALTIIDRTPDTVLPAVVSLSRTSSTGTFPIDVTSTGRSVTVKAHVTDNLSGVELINACIYAPSDDGYLQVGWCPGMELYSGTERDGWYRATMDIPAHSVGGDWNALVIVTDKAHPSSEERWLGPDLYRVWSAECDDLYRQLPGVDARFAVDGANNSAAPALVSMTASPTSVDTLPGPATVTVGVHATDAADEGVTQVGLYPYAIGDSAGAWGSSPRQNLPRAPVWTAGGTST